MTEIKANDQCGDAHRSTNFDLMGISMMMLIIMGHVAMYSGKLSQLGTTDYYITNLIRSFCIMAVNVFVIRSGYFSITLKWDKVLRFDLRTCFYTWTGLLVGLLCGIHKINFIEDIKLLFPVITKQYWYVTAYLALCILSPYINTFLKNADKRTLRSFFDCWLLPFLRDGNFLLLDQRKPARHGCGLWHRKFCLFVLPGILYKKLL